jgi:alpha-tubulin suppressor-like RCC1 family protein
MPGLSGVVAVAAGAYHSLALKSDGTVWAWGYDGYGELGNGKIPAVNGTPTQVNQISNVIAIAAGADFNLGAGKQRHRLGLGLWR